MKRTAWKWILSLAVASLAMLPTRAAATAPGNAPDEALVRMPIIVVAWWPRAAAERHDLIEDKAVLEAEGHTDLAVERVIKGDISPGRYQLLYGWGVDWQEDESQQEGHKLSERLGEVEDVTNPSIWFLSRKRGWDMTDPKVYLSLDTYRGVQPLELEPYFAALQSDDRDRKIAELLDSKSPAVVLRARDYTRGQPWYWEQIYALIHTGLPWMISSRHGATRLQQLLDDKDPAVRATALRMLVQRRDEQTVLPICRAAASIPRSWLNCDLDNSLAAWGDKRLVPALIACLQTDRYEGWGGEGVRITALKAQAALQRITGYLFPFDVRSSQRAWAKAQRFPDPAAQLKSLEESLGHDPNPLQGTAVEDLNRTAGDMLQYGYS